MTHLRVHALYHAPFEGLGSISTWLVKQSCHLEETKVYAGESLPLVNDFDWLIVMGGPMSVHDEQEFPWLVGEKRLITEAIQGGKAVLGICLGAQLIASVLGGRVTRNREKEIGWFSVFTHSDTIDSKPEARNWVSRIVPETLITFHWHGETFGLPEGAIPLSASEGCDNQGFAMGDKVIGLQFHPEMNRGGIEQLLLHCEADRKPGKFVQRDDSIFGRPEFYEANRFFLEELLSGLRNQALKF